MGWSELLCHCHVEEREGDTPPPHQTFVCTMGLQVHAVRPLSSRRATCWARGPGHPYSPEPSHPTDNQAVASQGPRLVEAAHLYLAGEWDPEGLRAVHVWEVGSQGQGLCKAPAHSAPQPCPRHSHSLARAMREVLTARDNSMGSSGGTTEVRISVHSRNSL